MNADIVTKRRLAFIGASAATVLGGFGLLGWITPWRELSSLIAESIPMAPTTAVTLLVLGGAILAIFLFRPHWRRPARQGLASPGE